MDKAKLKVTQRVILERSEAIESDSIAVIFWLFAKNFWGLYNKNYSMEKIALEERDEQLKKIKEEILHCQKCSLYQTRHYPVIGEGSHEAEIMFIGEAPGFYEDKTGHPFWGKAGKVLDELLSSVKLTRKDIYITNLLKCRPPHNRDPQDDEIIACSPYLLSQIDIIEPKIICTLGRYATKFILEKFSYTEKVEGISKIHGKKFLGKTDYGKIDIVPLYHPAVAVYNIKMMPILKNDFKLITQLVPEFKKI